jgi:hypothetical protein
VVDPAEQLQAHLDQAFAAALANDAPKWDALVRSLGLTPLTDEQRQFIRRSGVPKLKGVLPVELRVVLEAVRSKIVALPGAAKIQTDLEVFVEREMLRFIAAAQPPKAVMGNIFANAQQSAVRLGAAADAVMALKCGCCGAARPAGSDLRSCAFCGNALF